MIQTTDIKAVQAALSAKDKGTLTLALCGWAARCDQEAEAMDGFAVQFPAKADQCRRNAAASRQFAAEARDLSNRLNGIA